MRRKSIRLLAVFTICFSLLAQALPMQRVAEAADILGATLTNPGFELESVEGAAPGWAVDPATAAYGTTVVSDVYARTGSHSLLFHDRTAGASPAGSYRVLSEPLAAGAEDTVSFSIFIYKAAAADQSHGVQPVIHFYNAAGTQIGVNAFTNYGKDAVPVGTWFRATVSAKAPIGTASFKVGLYSGFPSLTKVFIDDASVTVVPAETPLPTSVQNPSFEADLVGGAIPGWSLGELTTGTLERSDTAALTGTYSLYFKDSSTTAWTRAMSDKVAVTAGETIVVSANAYVLSQTHNIVLQVYYYGANNAQVGANETLFSSNSLGTRKWSAMRVLSKVPAGAVSARVGLSSGAPSLTEAYFDDVAIEVQPPEVPLDRSYQAPVSLGDMVKVNLGQAGAIQTNAAGENEAYFVTNGSPGSFFAVDGETGELKFQEVIPGTIATWAMTIGPDKNVYFSGTETGNLYRYLPLEKRVENLGYNQTDNWVWELTTIGDKMYGGTFNTTSYGKVFEYDLATGEFRNYGAVEAEQQYVRGIAVDDRYIYAALGATMRLYKIDRVTGEKTEIHVPGYSGKAGILADVFVLNGKLFVSVSTVNMVVIDIATGEVEGTFQHSAMISEPSPDDPNLIYYKYLTKFYEYDIAAKKQTEIVLPYELPDTARVKDYAWIELQSGEKAGQTVLAMITQYGEYILIDPKDKWMSFVELEIGAQPVGIQSLKTGFDGRIYMGGYQRGMSIYNPFTNRIDVNISSFAQPEGIGFMNGKVYYGTYVGAIMYDYDPTKEIVLNQNPRPVFDIEHQDRPFVITSGDDKLFVGTVPDYGFLGGALAVYDEATNEWKQFDHEELVANQSIIGLAYKDGLLYGSTTVWGGLGKDPSETEAKIFVWDVENERKIDEFTLDDLEIDEAPRMIGSIAFGPDGLLWGVVDGTIFAMDAATKEIVKSKQISPSLYNTSKWLPYELEWGPDGILYTTLSRKLIAIDPETLRYKEVYSGFVNLMTLGVDGSIYFAPEAGSKLSRIAVPETDATLASITIGGQPLAGFSPGVRSYKASMPPMAKVAAVPTQPGATAFVEDLRPKEWKVIVHVTGTDGKSKQTYTIEVDKPGKDDPGKPNQPGNPNR
ncbi:hypothetical protein [Paenibacillus sp.]|uniref:hypothetical protein n=1 Tax=Paenibacillus sp. TaxID=58172 RepID=UPI002811D7FE|nr:hypothetical protein [Paenibacillus sp.]